MRRCRGSSGSGAWGRERGDVRNGEDERVLVPFRVTAQFIGDLAWSKIQCVGGGILGRFHAVAEPKLQHRAPVRRSTEGAAR